MTPDSKKDLPASVRARLLNLAKQRGEELGDEVDEPLLTHAAIAAEPHLLLGRSEVRVPFAACEVGHLAVGMPDTAQAHLVLDARLGQEGQQALEDLSGDVGVPDGCMGGLHRDRKGLG